MSITVYEGYAVENDDLSSYRFSVWLVLFFSFVSHTQNVV